MQQCANEDYENRCKTKNARAGNLPQERGVVVSKKKRSKTVLLKEITQRREGGRERKSGNGEKDKWIKTKKGGCGL